VRAGSRYLYICRKRKRDHRLVFPLQRTFILSKREKEREEGENGSFDEHSTLLLAKEKGNAVSLTYSKKKKKNGGGGTIVLILHSKAKKKGKSRTTVSFSSGGEGGERKRETSCPAHGDLSYPTRRENRKGKVLLTPVSSPWV